MLPESARPGRRFAWTVATWAMILPLWAGGPRFVAGPTYFDPAQAGQPILWSGGVIAYFTDQGPLGSTVSNSQANAMVAAAAAAWNGVPTAAVSLSAAGPLAENVSGQNVIASASGVTLPADIESTATATPVAVVYDADGAVIDALYGIDASDPDDCVSTGAIAVVDNFSPAGAIAHAMILLNGRCTGTAIQLQQLQLQTMRAFGRVLGLDWSQANDAVLFGPGAPSLQQLQGWPIMRPIDLYCNQLSIQCLPNALQLKPDDIAVISRLYPVTPANQGRYPGKQITAAATISIHGNVYFRRGQGMQGVNLVARPVNPGSLQPEDQYATAAVTGTLFTGNRGNPVNGPDDASGRALSDFGSDDPLLQGSYDLSGLLLPTGMTTADYQLTLEAVNPLYTAAYAVGPYSDGSPAPSGTLPVLILHGLAAGASVEQDITIEDSAGDLQSGASGAPAAVPPTGEWAGRLAIPGATSWLAVPVLGGRHLTVEAEATDEAGTRTQNKLRPVLGIWNGSSSTSDTPTVAATAPFNSAGIGTTALGIDAVADGELLLGIADQRGDGRPDYAYRGRVLYAATVSPSQLPLSGGHIRIEGSGFRHGMTLALGASIAASIDLVTSNLIIATVPPVAVNTGSLDLVLTDPVTNGTAIIAGGISLGAASGDVLTLVTAPPATVSVGASSPWVVQVLGPDQSTPVGGVTVAFSILQGSGAFTPCAAPGCTAVTTGDGFAGVAFTPGTASAIKLQAALPGGATLTAELTGTPTPSLTPVTPLFYLAAGAMLAWNSQVAAISNGLPVSNATVNWLGMLAANGQGGASSTTTQGIAGFVFSLGPWAAGTSGTIQACLGAAPCASIPVFVIHPESENLVAVSGFDQALQAADTPQPVIVRLVTPTGQPVVGGPVLLRQTIRAFAPRCPTFGQCPVGRVLSVSSLSVPSDLNGLASFTPILPPGVAVTVTGVVEAGTYANLPFHLDVYP